MKIGSAYGREVHEHFYASTALCTVQNAAICISQACIALPCNDLPTALSKGFNHRISPCKSPTEKPA
jgi:hypothetical protein